MKNTFFNLSASVLLVTAIGGTFTSAPAHAVSCSTTNISLGGVNATACDGANIGNDTGYLEDRLDKGLFSDLVGDGVDWTEVGKSDNVSNLFIAAANNSTTGAWSLKQTLTSKTFVVSLKAGNSYSAYLFKDYNFSQGLTGIFNTIGVSVNGQGNARALSHASLYVSNIVSEPTTEVPEPATLLGLGLAVGGMVISRRRQSR